MIITEFKEEETEFVSFGFNFRIHRNQQQIGKAKSFSQSLNTHRAIRKRKRKAAQYSSPGYMMQPKVNTYRVFENGSSQNMSKVVVRSLSEVCSLDEGIRHFIRLK